MTRAVRMLSATILLLAICRAVAAQGSASAPRTTTLPTAEALPSHGRLGGVAVDRSGNVFVSNFSATVWRVTPDGTVLALASNLQGSSGNATDSAGNLYQASFVDGRIVRIAPDGSTRTLVTGLNGPVGLAVGGDGAVYACACRANAIVRATADGSAATFARHDDLDCPNGLTWGPDGRLYVVSFNNGHVVRIDSVGRAERFATVPDGRNAHIAYARGAFWVTKIEANRVYRLSRDGRAERYAGTGQLGVDDGLVAEAPLSRPNGIAVTPDGSALIINTLDGEWRGTAPTRMVLRRVELPNAPADVEHIEIPAGGMVFDALAAGPEDGELVLLLHGFPQTSHAFLAQLRALGAAGYRAVAPDQRGYSPGARPRSVEDYGMGYLVEDVVAIADALGHSWFHLVGHDWGGAVAWVTATRHGERVRTLTVLSTPHFAAFGAQLADPESDQSRRSSYFSDFAAPDAADRMLADDKAGLRAVLSGVPAADRAVYLERLGSKDALVAALMWYRASAPRPPSGQASSGASPPRIRVPTLYVWGTRDGAFGRAAAEKTGDFVAGSYEFVPLEGVGHWLPEVAADTVTQLLLRRLQPPDGPAAGTPER